MRAFVVAVLMALFAGSGFASIVSSAMTGRVTSGGSPAAGVTVSAYSPVIGTPRVTTTSGRGTWWIGALPPGAYDVTFSGTGMQSLTRRVSVELARVARADASLEPSEDEESVTSTVRNIAVTDTTAITTHFDDAMLDRLPIRRDATHAAAITPGSTDAPLLIAGGVVAYPSLFGEEATEQFTVLRGATPIEYDRFGARVAVGQMRMARTSPYLSLRSVLSHGDWIPEEWHGTSTSGGLSHMLESASGGRLFENRLSLFAAGWSGDDRSAGIESLRGLTLNAGLQAGASHQLGASWIDSRASIGGSEAATSLMAIRYTGVAGDFVTQAVASRSGNDTGLSTRRDDLLGIRSSMRFSDHLLAAGVDRWNTSTLDFASLFVSDRWSANRWTVDAGLRRAFGDLAGRTLPRLAVTWDLPGNGRQALSASHGHYLDVQDTDSRVVRASSLGYASAIGTSGAARVDLIRSNEAGLVTNGIEGEARYRLFDRFEAGGNYTWRDTSTLKHRGNLWLGAAFPFFDRHELGMTILHRYADDRAEPHTTDLALRYALPLRRARLTVAADVLDLLDDVGGRVWLRLTM